MATRDINFILSFTDKGTAKLKQVVGGTTKELGNLTKESGKTEKGMKKLKKGVEDSEKGMGKFKKAMKSTWAQMAMGMGVMSGITGAIRMVKTAITSTIQVGRDFEREWANVTTMISDATVNTDMMRMELINLSPVLGNTTDLAKGMYQVLSASIDPAKALDVLAVSAMSAQAGVTQTAVAVDAITTVLNAYRMEAEDAERVSDVMFQTVKRGKLTYEGMAGALGTVVPIASQVGIKFEDIAGAMATLTRQGVDVNTTTMQLRQVMVSVLKPTQEASETAQKLGLNFSASGLKAKGLAGFLMEVKEKAGDDVEALTNLFGNVRSLTAVMGLAGQSAKEFAYDVSLMGKASGDTKEALEKQMNSLDFWLGVIKNAIDKFKIAIWEGLSKPFRQSIDSIDALREKIDLFTAKLIRAGVNIGRGIYNVITTLHKFRNVIQTVITALIGFKILKGITSSFKAFKAGMVALIPKLTSATTVTSGLKIAMTALTGPIGLVAGALVALGITAIAVAKKLNYKKVLADNVTALREFEIQADKSLRLDFFLEGLKKNKEAYTAFWEVVNDKGGDIVKVMDQIEKGEKKWTENFAIYVQGARLRYEEYAEARKTADEKIRKSMDLVEATEEAKTQRAEVMGIAVSALSGKYIDQEEALMKLDAFMNATVGTHVLHEKMTQNEIKALEAVTTILRKSVGERLAVEEARKKELAMIKSAEKAYNKLIPSQKEMEINLKALGNAMASASSKGMTTSQVYDTFGQAIVSAYQEASEYAKIFKTKVDPALTKAYEGVLNLNKPLEVQQGVVTALGSKISWAEIQQKAWTGEQEKASKLVGGMFVPALIDGVKWMNEMGKSATVLGVKTKTQLATSLKDTEKNFKKLHDAGELLPEDTYRVVTDIIKEFKRLGEDVPPEYKKIQKESKNSADNMKKDWEKSLSHIGNLFGILGDDIGGAFGNVVSSIGSVMSSVASAVEGGAKNAKDVIASIAPVLGNLGGQLGELIGGVKEGEKSFAKMGASIGGSIGEMIPVFGKLGKAIGSAIGGLIGGIFKKKDKKTEEQRLAEQLEQQIDQAKKALSGVGEISDATAEAIAKSREEMEGWVATAYHMPDVIRDVGVTQENVNELWKKSASVLDAYEKGLIDAKKASESAGESFSLMVTEAQRMGTEGSLAMVEFIEKVKASGLEIPEVTNYINEQLGVIKQGTQSASEALQTLADNLPIDRLNELKEKQKELTEQLKGTKEGSEAYAKLKEELGKVDGQITATTNNISINTRMLETQAMATFSAMIANGASYAEAMNSIGGTLDQLKEAHTAMGTEAGAGIQELMKIREVTDSHKGLFDNIQANKNLLDALANTGSLTAESFKESMYANERYYKQLTDAGLSGNQALAQMAPSLERLKFLSEEHGFKIDEATQKMIDQAEQAGLMKKEELSVQDTMMAGFGEIIKALGGDIPEAFQKSIEKMKELGEDAKGTAGDIKEVEHAIHGSGVTGAMDTLDQKRLSVFENFKLDTGFLIEAFGDMESTMVELGASTEDSGVKMIGTTDKVREAFYKAQEQVQEMDTVTKVAFSGMSTNIQKVSMDVMSASKEMNKLQHEIHGSGVTGALDKMSDVSKDVFNSMEDQTGDATKSVREMSYAIKDTGDEMEKMGSKAESNKDKVMKMGSEVSKSMIQATSSVMGIQLAMNSLTAPGAQIPGGKKTKKIPVTKAQEGAHFTVREPEHLVLAHRGEDVRVTPPGRQPEGQVVNVSVKPVMVPWKDMEAWVLRLVEEATDNERLRINRKALKVE